MTDIEQALATLAAPPPGVASDINRAAYEAAFPDRPIRPYDTETQARIRAALAATEPLIVADVVRRILAGSTATVDWAIQLTYTAGRPPAVRPMADRELAEAGVKALNNETDAALRKARGVEAAEVVCRQVRVLRDGVTLVGPWAPEREG